MPGREPYPDSPPPPSTGDDAPGVRGGFASFADGLRQYLLARGELLSIESREAARVVAQKGAHGAVLAAAIFFAYALLLAAAVSVTGHWLAGILPGSWSQFGWQTAAAAAAILHLAVAAFCYRSLRKRPEQPLFEITRSEVQKDRQWLNDQQTSSGNKS